MFVSEERIIRIIGKALQRNQWGDDDWHYYDSIGVIKNYGSEGVKDLKRENRELKAEVKNRARVLSALLDHLKLEVEEDSIRIKKK